MDHFLPVVDSYEEAIAEKIGVSPSVIWPSRYFSDARLSA
ncbi:helix-turn-helix domain-containing protein [Enterobacter asburiae]